VGLRQASSPLGARPRREPSSIEHGTSPWIGAAIFDAGQYGWGTSGFLYGSGLGRTYGAAFVSSNHIRCVTLPPTIFKDEKRC
jgi:hypothetical protein